MDKRDLYNYEVMHTLEEAGYVLALDAGVHSHCKFGSNCPVSIKLREIIAEIGKDITEITPSDNHSLNVNLSSLNVDANLQIRLFNKVLDVDFNDVVTSELSLQMERKLNQIRGYRDIVLRLVHGFQESYNNELYALKRNISLPALQYDVFECISHPTIITSTSNRYIFVLDFHYSPEYTVTSGRRYVLSEKHKKATDRKIKLLMAVTKDNLFSDFKLIDENGGKFVHYHGVRTDCWGNQQHPRTWDRSLRSLHKYRDTLQSVLKTINLDSLMIYDPLGLPTIEQIRSEAELLGTEGEIKIGEERKVAEQQVNRPRWGGGW